MGVKTLEELEKLEPVEFKPGVPEFLAMSHGPDDLICGDVDGELWQPALTADGMKRVRFYA